MNRYVHVLLSATVFVMTALSAAPAMAANGPILSVVYPTGVYPDDIKNVQAALDKGGIVFLKAFNTAHVPTAFNFGTNLEEAGGVNLTVDVTVIGESVGKYRATIKGGFGPIAGFVPVKSTIRGIVFESPVNDAIAILSSTGTEISDNMIHNVVPLEIRFPSGHVITEADGIDILGDGTSITGNVRIAGNVIDGLGAIFSNGIQLDTVNGDVEVSGNTVKNVASEVTLEGNGMAFTRIEKAAWISNNLVVPGPSQNGNTDGFFIAGNRDARYKVVANRIFSDGPGSFGIALAGDGTTGTVNAFIGGNQLAVHSASGGAGVVVTDLVTDALIANNDIQGDGQNALVVSSQGNDIEIASLNRFFENNIEEFTSSQSDIFFDVNAKNNQVIGRCKTVIDLGVGNSATCGESPTTTAKEFSATAAVSSQTHPAHAFTTMQDKRQHLLQMRGLDRSQAQEK